MRLDINAGGLDCFFGGLNGFVKNEFNKDIDTVGNALKTINSRMSNVCGGLSSALGLALGYIKNGKTATDTRYLTLQRVANKADTFIQVSINTDSTVAKNVSSSKSEQYGISKWVIIRTLSSIAYGILKSQLGRFFSEISEAVKPIVGRLELLNSNGFNLKKWKIMNDKERSKFFDLYLSNKWLFLNIKSECCEYETQTYNIGGSCDRIFYKNSVVCGDIDNDMEIEVAFEGHKELIRKISSSVQFGPFEQEVGTDGVVYKAVGNSGNSKVECKYEINIKGEVKISYEIFTDIGNGVIVTTEMGLIKDIKPKSPLKDYIPQFDNSTVNALILAILAILAASQGGFVPI